MIVDTNKNIKEKDYSWVIIVFGVFLFSFSIYLGFYKTNFYELNKNKLNEDFIKIDNNDLKKINIDMNFNKNIYVFELYRYDKETCEIGEYEKDFYNINEYGNKMNDHIVFFENNIYVNKKLTKEFKKDVVSNINICIDKANDRIKLQNKIKESWEQKE